MSVVGCARFSKLAGFLWSVFLVNCDFHLVSESLSQFVFGQSKLVFDYLAFWQVAFFGHCQKLSCV